FTKTGAGTLTLTGANTYTAQTYILGGTVNVQSATALGINPGQAQLTAPLGAGTLVGSGATLQLQGGITTTESLELNGGTLESLIGNNVVNGSILLNAPSTIAVDVNQMALTGAISGDTDWTKTGGGTLTLSGFSTYTGQTNINAGVVQLFAPTNTGSTN